MTSVTIEEEKRRSYLDYAMSVIAAGGTARRDLNHRDLSLIAVSQVKSAVQWVSMIGGTMKRIVIPLLTCLTILNAARAAAPSTDACLGHEHDHDPAAIIAACTSLVKSPDTTRSNRAEAFARRGTAYYAQRDYDRAIADFSNAIRLDSKNKDAFAERGFAYGVTGHNDQAIADFSKAIELDPKYENAIVARGIAYLSTGHFKRAIADFDRALELDPKDAQVLYERGTAKEQLGDATGAREDKAKALAIDPNVKNDIGE